MITTSAPPATRFVSPVFLAIVVTVLAWASAFIVIRGVAPHFQSGALALARLTVGAVVLGGFMVKRSWVRVNAREWALIIVFGVAWFGAYNVTLNFAEHTLDAGTTAMLVGIGPVLIALGAGLFLGEGIPRWLAIGAGVAFCGVLLIGDSTGLASGFSGGIGLLWALLAAVTYAIGVLCQKPVLRRLPARQVTFLGCLIGAVCCLPFAGQLGVTTYVVPALVVLLGFVFFREVPVPLAIVGGVVCLVGVALSRGAHGVRARSVAGDGLDGS